MTATDKAASLLKTQTRVQEEPEECEETTTPDHLGGQSLESSSVSEGKDSGEEGEQCSQVAKASPAGYLPGATCDTGEAGRRCHSAEANDPSTPSGSSSVGNEDTDADERVARGRLVGNTWLACQNAALEDLQRALQEMGPKKMLGPGPSPTEVDAHQPAPQDPDPSQLSDEWKAPEVPPAEEKKSLEDDQEDRKKKQAKCLGKPGRRKAVRPMTDKERWALERQQQQARVMEEERRLEELRQKRAAASQQQIQEREERRRAQEETAQQHLSAHKRHLKAIQPRINKGDLVRLGAQFAAKGQQVEEGGQEGTQQVLLVQCGPTGPIQLHENEPPAGGGRGKARGPSRKESPRPGWRLQLATHQQVPSNRTCVGQEEAGTPSPQPGRQKLHDHHHQHPPGFPEVQIFCPHGSDWPSPNPFPDNPGAPCPRASCSPTQQVLQEIQCGLLVTRNEADEDAWKLPPEHSSGKEEHLDTRDATALKIEQLRWSLEEQLGQDIFVKVYRYLQEIQLDRNYEDEADLGGSHLHENLEHCLGSKMPLARLVYKLIRLEEKVFC